MEYIKVKAFITLVFCLTISSCAVKDSFKNNAHTPKNNTYVIKNINIIPMTSINKVIKKATVVIHNNIIQSINGNIPRKAKVIDGTDKWLIPGLIDMHVHTNASINLKGNLPTQGATFFIDTQDVMTTHIANGVTTIFELDGRVEHLAQRNEITQGKVIGPRMAIAPVVNGGKTSNGGRIVNNSSDARQAVKSLKAEGYNFIKAYSHLNIESYKAVVDEAKKQNMQVVGHIPDVFKGKTQEAFVPNFGLVAHAEEFSKQIRELPKTKKEAKQFAEIAKKNNTWLVPNLIAIVKIRDQIQSIDSIRNMKTLQYVHPILQDKWINHNNYKKHKSEEFLNYLNDLIRFHKELVLAFKDAGIPMVTGTDAGLSGIITGFAMHDELELLVEAGLTNGDALISATKLPAKWLKIDDKVGTVEENKYADLIILNSNPLEDIKNTRKINGVFVNGIWLNKNKIDKMLSNLANWNTSNKDKYKWKNIKNY